VGDPALGAVLLVVLLAVLLPSDLVLGALDVSVLESLGLSVDEDSEDLLLLDRPEGERLSVA